MVTSISVRQSPPPVTDGRGIPSGAILSPPVSPPDSSSDDELPEVRGRQIESLKALHDAISQIPQRRSSSPTKVDSGDLLVLPSQTGAMAEGMHISFSTGSLDGHIGGARRFSHARSATEPNASISKSAGNSLTGSEEDSEEDVLRKPQMVRKKSGELVRPALRPSSNRRRPSSMPGTPTFSKAVHFDSHLEHVRHFLQVDRPLAVSAGSSPVDNYESDGEYPFPGDDRSPAAGRTPPFEWEIVVTNFPVETPARKSQAIRLERVWLSNDQKSLIGSVVVANLAFQKFVTCRFTLDYWKTTSEVAAEYICEVQPRQTPQGHDRFHFTIKLSDLANLESKTLYFCIRYNVNGQEYWDNNGGTNFQVDFRKKMLPQNGKKGVIGAASRPANGLPKSSRRGNPSSSPRPKSMPGMDEFGENAKINFDQSIHDYLGESGPTAIRLKGVKSSAALPSDNLSSRLSAPSGQAFANRYDFAASLTAAIQTTKDVSTKPDGLYMKSHRKPTVTGPNASKNDPKTETAPAPAPTVLATNKSSLSVPGAEAPASPSISSSSYEELVNKYCFFGSKSQRFDGADDGLGTNSTTSSHGSPTQNSGLHHLHGTQHHTLHRDPNPYFQYTSSGLAFVSSPAHSPVKGVPDRTASPFVGQPRTTTVTDQRAGESVPSASMGGYPPFAGMSPNGFPYQQLRDRFPFTGAETHSATAIRG